MISFASDAEAEVDPRARSGQATRGVFAPLRRLEAADLSIFDLPNLASLEKLVRLIC